MQNKKLTLSLVASCLLATNLLSNEIYVTSATKSEQSIKDVTSNINVITSIEIEEKKFTTIQDALNTLPGVSITTSGGIGSQSSLRIRGNDTRSTLVLIDGVKYNDYTGISGANFANILISDVERIELIKGAQSGIWGADASAGVIHIITKKPNKGLNTTISSEIGSFNTKKFGTNISYRNDKFYSKLNVQKIMSDGFTSYATRYDNIDIYEDDKYTNRTIGFNFGLYINDSNTIDIKHKNIKAMKQTDSFSDTIGDYSKSREKLTSINFKNKYESITSNLYFNKNKIDKEIQTQGTEYDGGYNEFGFNSTLDYRNKDFITIGLDYNEYERLNDVNKKYNSKSLFLTNSNYFSDLIDGDMIITQSIRFDDYSSFQEEFTGKFGIKNIHNSVEGLTTSFNFGTAYNAPSLSHLYAPDIISPWVGVIPYGNENLSPEKTKTYDFTIEYNNLSTTIYYSEVKDYIFYDYDSDTMTYNGYSNLEGVSKYKGIEISYEKNIGSDTLFSLDYTRMSAKNPDKEQLHRVPNQTLKFSIDYYGLNKTHIGLFGEYIGKRYNDTNKRNQTGKYTVWNSIVNYDINKNLKTYLKIDNLFDKYYQSVKDYATSPRAFYVGLKATF